MKNLKSNSFKAATLIKKFRKLFVIAAILFSNFYLAQAKTGVVEIAMRSTNGSDIELINFEVETQKVHTIVLVNENGETFTKSIRLTNRMQEINFDLPKGKYQLCIVEVQSGSKQKHTFKLD